MERMGSNCVPCRYHRPHDGCHDHNIYRSMRAERKEVEERGAVSKAVTVKQIRRSTTVFPFAVKQMLLGEKKCSLQDSVVLCDVAITGYYNQFLGYALFL